MGRSSLGYKNRCFSCSYKQPGGTFVRRTFARQLGRIGSFRGIRAGKAEYGATVFGKTGVGSAAGPGGYEPLVKEIAKFFRTGKPPLDAAFARISLAAPSAGAQIDE